VPTELHEAYFSFTNTSQDASSYTWHFGDNSTSTDVNPQHHYVYAGNYTVVLEASNDIGCVDTAMRQFFMVIPDKILDIPNAFSPNGDGVNDKWEIAGLRGNTDCEVLIFNRWGQQVFSSHGYDTPWDGTGKGHPVSAATYYYVIKTSLRNYNGWLQLLR
jgi:gliding motility-associated-like protein